jgi:hypothetical protein
MYCRPRLGRKRSAGLTVETVEGINLRCGSVTAMVSKDMLLSMLPASATNTEVHD